MLAYLGLSKSRVFDTPYYQANFTQPNTPQPPNRSE